MLEWLSAITLDNKEYIIKHWGLKDGLLVLSSNRVMHLKLDRARHSYVLQESISLDLIKSISGSGGLWSQNVFVHATNGSFTFEGIHPKEGMVANKMPRDDFKERTLEQVKEFASRSKTIVIDFSFLRTFAENGGIVLTTLKCPECHAPIEMPTNGTETSCKYCKSSIHAVDIFNKMKGLMS